MQKSLGRLALMFALMGAAAVPSTAFTQTFTDTDGDGINDAVESPSCVGDNGASRGGFVDSRGCTGDFFACVAARPDAWYTCGAPESWNSIGLRAVIDAVPYVIDAHGRQYQLHEDHMPQWDRGTKSWTCSTEHVSVLHKGTKAYPKVGRPVETGLPPQTPPFCHPAIIRVDRVGGVDATARAEVKSAREIADRVAALIEDPDRGFKVVRKTAEDTAAKVNDEETGLGATRATANRLARLIEDPDRGFKVVRKTAEDTAAKVNDEETGLDATRATADSAFLEVYNTSTPSAAGAIGNGVAGDSRVDANETRSKEALAGVQDLRGKEVVIEGGWGYYGNGYLNDDWSRPVLTGPHLAVGFRRTFPAWIMMIRAHGSPALVNADGFSVGGNVAFAARIRDLPLFVGVSVGGSGWASGAYAPGSRGYAAVSGGGLDVDGLVLVDIPRTPLSVVGSVGVRVHGVKAVGDRDPIVIDPAGSIALQLRF